MNREDVKKYQRQEREPSLWPALSIVMWCILCILLIGILFSCSAPKKYILIDTFQDK